MPFVATNRWPAFKRFNGKLCKAGEVVAADGIKSTQSLVNLGWLRKVEESEVRGGRLIVPEPKKQTGSTLSLPKTTMAQMSAREGIKFAKDCDDLALLQSAYDTEYNGEGRSSILDALADKIDRLNKKQAADDGNVRSDDTSE